MKDGKRKIVRIVHMDGYKCSWWERICLHFVDMTTHESEFTSMSFKYLFSQMYIYQLRHKTLMADVKEKWVYN